MSEKSSKEPNGSKCWSSNQSNNVSPNINIQETDSEIEERLANIFKRLDENSNGRIDIQELTSALKDSGMSHQYAEVRSLQSIF